MFELSAINASNEFKLVNVPTVTVIMAVYVIFQLPAGKFSCPELLPKDDIKVLVLPVFVVEYPKRFEPKLTGL